MNQNQASDRNQAGLPMCTDFLQGHNFNGTQTTPATQTPLFVQWPPGVKQENGELSQQTDFLQGQNFNGTQTTPATQTPLFVQWLPGVKQENGELSQQNGHFMQNYAQQPPAEPPGPNIGVLDWAQQYGSTGDLAVWTLAQSAPSLPQGGAGNNAHASMQPEEEALEEKRLRRINNRQAAKKYRQKKKEYVKCLESRMAVLENQNKTLIEELRVLKDVYRVKTE